VIWSTLPEVEQAILDSLERGRPAILTTDCPEVHQALYAALAGCCDAAGLPARDGTARFSGEDAGRRWDVRLVLELPRVRAVSPGALRELLYQAGEELRMALSCYTREQSVQAATAINIAIVNCEQARADIEMDRGQ